MYAIGQIQAAEIITMFAIPYLNIKNFLLISESLKLKA